MMITLNGQSYDLPESLTISALFIHLNLEQKGRIVELNGTILEPKTFDSQILSEGDKVEIIQFMGGG